MWASSTTTTPSRCSTRKTSPAAPTPSPSPCRGRPRCTSRSSSTAGLATSNALDVTRSATARSTSPNSGTATTTAPGELVLGIFSTQSYTTFTPGAGFTTRASVNTDARIPVLMVADRVLATPGSVAATATLSTTDIWGAGLITFRSAAGGATNRPPVLSTAEQSGARREQQRDAGADGKRIPTAPH